MSPALRLRRLDALATLSSRLAAESAGGVLGDCLDVLLDATSARCAAAFASDGAVEPVAERRLTLRPTLDLTRVRQALRALAERCATSRRALRYADLRRETETIPDAGELVAFGVRAAIVLPIMHRRTVLGTIALLFDDPAMLDEETLRFADSVTNVAALALERDRQVEDAHGHRQRLVGPASSTGLGLVTNTVAHELKSPTGALMLQHDELLALSEQLALLAGPSDTALGGAAAELAELASEIGVAIQRLRETVDKLTSVGRPDLPPARLDVGNLAREAMIVGRPHLERLGVTLNERFDPDCFTLGRKDALEQVILNLVFNAADACNGGSRPQVWLRVAVDGAHVVMIVEDNGPGVPADAIDNIFQPFFTTKGQDRSAGLGLKICSDVVAEHGGHIEVHERPGGGAAFHVLLPRVDAEGQPALSESPLAHPLGSGEKRRVLVIDDDPVVARALRRGLKPHDVRTAATASEAEIALLEPDYEPDLVVCDVYLPGVNGNVLHERILAERPAVAARFVFMTGGGLGRAEADYLKGSGRLSLLKPVDVKALVQLLEPSNLADSAPPASVRTLSDPGGSERPTMPPAAPGEG